MNNFKFNFLSRGQLESLSHNKFLLTGFKTITCHKVFLVTYFLPLLLACWAEIILNNHRTAVQKRKRDAYRKRVKTNESLKLQLTSCEKNQNTECQSEYNKWMRPGWPILRKLWHLDTFKEIPDKRKKMKKISLTYLVLQRPQGNPKATETIRKCPSFAKRALPSFPRDRWISK